MVAACVILDRISNVLHFCLGEPMIAAKDGLHCLPPNLKPLQDLIGLLKRSWTTAKRKKKWKSFDTTYQAASQRFTTIAKKCADEERAVRKSKKRANILGILVIIMLDAGALFVFGYFPADFEFSAANATALLIFITVGLFLWIIGKKVLQCMGIHDTDFGKSEQDFRSICLDLDSLWNAGHEIKKALSQVHIIDSNIVSRVDTIDGCVDNNANIVLLRDTVQELIRECGHSSGTIRKWKKDLTDRKEKLCKVEL